MKQATRIAWAFSSMAALTMGCASEDNFHQHEDDYKLWSNSQKCLVSKSLKPAIKICVYGQGNLERGRKLVHASLTQWLDALRPIHAGVTKNIEFTCEDPHGYVRIRGGSGRAFASPGKTTVYNTSNIGTYLHEFGHAFACLGDTYRNGTAGRCQPGQPNSIMCDGKIRKDLTADDVAGVRVQFERIVGPVNPNDQPPPPPSTPDDEDGDGIVNADDLCPETPMGSHVEGSGERRGCAEGQTPGSQQSNDGDSDGVIDKFDKCPHTPEGKWVWTDQHNGRWRGCAPGEVPQW